MVRLTGGEAALLAALARKPNEVLSREDIAAALGMDEAGERAIDVQVTRLRRKIEADPREPRFLHTVRGRGYVLKPGVCMRRPLPISRAWSSGSLPRSLLGRSLLMILLPLVLLQAVALQIFYGSHLDIVSRRLGGAVAGELAYTLELMRPLPGRSEPSWILRSAREQFDLSMRMEPGRDAADTTDRRNILGPMDDDLAGGAARSGSRCRSPWTGPPIRNRC